MKKLPKINLAIVKEYLIKHGEKITLGTCLFLALFLGLLGFWRALSAGHADNSSNSWVDDFILAKNNIDRDIRIAPVKDLEKPQKDMLNPERYVWSNITLPHQPMPYAHIPDEKGSDKRAKPTVLPIRADTKQKINIQLDYVRAAGIFYLNDQDTRWELAAEGAPKLQPPQAGAVAQMPVLAKEARPMRAIVGTAIFPMKEQVEIFRKALRMTSQKELFEGTQEDLPRLYDRDLRLGFLLKRYEIGADGKPVNPQGEILIGVDKTGKFKASESIKRMLRDAVYDEKMPEYLEKYIFAGLSMPMPKLGNAHYPKPNLDGVDIARWYEDDEQRGGNIAMAPPPGPQVKLPGVPGGKKVGRPDPKLFQPPQQGDAKEIGPDAKERPITYKELYAANDFLADRLFKWDKKDWDKYVNVYHVLGRFPPNEGKDAIIRQPGVANDPGRYFSAWKIEPPGAGKPGEPQVFPPPRGGVGPEGKAEDGTPTYPEWDRDAVVRFIDPEVEPGKTYQYEIQIRMVNPNFGKPRDAVAFEGLTKFKELDPPSPAVKSGLITIPQEYFLFAVDQKLLDDWAAGVDTTKATIPVKERDTTTFQIHQWVKKKDDLKENMTHMIGDLGIGERIVVRRGDPIGVGAEVVVPVWKKTRDSFEVPWLIPDPKPNDKTRMKPGIRINLTPTTIRPDGVEEELPFPVLVDFTGGKRFKPNNGPLEEESAVDAMIIMPDGKLKVLNSRIHSEVKDRQDGVIQSRRRAEAFMNPGSEPKKGGPVIPKGKLGR